MAENGTGPVVVSDEAGQSGDQQGSGSAYEDTARSAR